MIGTDRRRRIERPLMLRTLAALLACVATPAWAVDRQACRAEVRNLTAAIPGGLTPSWAETVQSHYDAVNAIRDMDALNASLMRVWEESDAYDRNPDPDGDGLAISPAAFSANSVLQNCLHRARKAEIDASSGTTAAGTAEADTAEARTAEAPDAPARTDLSSGPTKIDASEPWFSMDDFPATAIREERQGVVRYELTIDTVGRVAECRASGPAGSADLEAATCAAVQARARFNPATDEAGKPMNGRIAGTVRWTIPAP